MNLIVQSKDNTKYKLCMFLLSTVWFDFKFRGVFFCERMTLL